MRNSANRLRGSPVPRVLPWPSLENLPTSGPTWLPRLLTGENSCEWAVWFKARHRN